MSKLVTKEILDTIFKELMAGKSLTSICKNNDGFPHRQTVMSHIQKDQEVFERYQAARAIQGEIIADEMKDLLDAAPPTTMTEATWRRIKLDNLDKIRRQLQPLGGIRNKPADVATGLKANISLGWDIPGNEDK